MDRLVLKATARLLQLPLILAALIFLPAWTLDYWEAWLFSTVFFACSVAITLYLAARDPKLLERRMNVGPGAEKEISQKVIVAVALGSFAVMPVLSAIDHRLGWSHVPTSVVILGDLLIALSFVGFYRVFRANTFGSATIEVVEGQKVIATGPYAVVRHPMYSWALVMALGIPLSLGSWWGLLMVAPALIGIVWRLLDEERFLAENLAGYVEYMSKVRHRLVPRIW